MITEILTWLATPFTALVEGWSDRKTLDVETKAKLAIAKAENKIRLETAKVDAEIARSQKEAEVIADYDQQAVKNMQSSWKDEYILLLHTLPIYGYIIPSETVHQGLDTIWEKLATAPQYWWIIYIGIVASTYGLRWLFNKHRVSAMIDGSKRFKEDNNKNKE